MNLGDGGSQFDVFCDMSLQGGGWTVIQRRVSNTTSFDRNWLLYKVGFGNLDGNFWLGLENIHRIVSSQSYELYVGLQSFFPPPVELAFARYGRIRVGPESDGYRLGIGEAYPNSTAGDSFRFHDGERFSTPDRDNDAHPQRHCAQDFSAGWWYKSCFQVHFNGIYSNAALIPDGAIEGIIYRAWLGRTASMKNVVMAVRPVA